MWGGLRSAILNSLSTSLKRRSLVRLGCLLTVIFVVAGVVEVKQGAEARERLVQTRAQLLAQLQASALAGPMWSLDDDQVRNLLRDLERDPDFVVARILDSRGNLFREHVKSAEGSDDIVADAAIVHEDRPIGTLQVHLSRAGLNASVRSNVYRTLGLNGIMLAVLLGTVWGILEAILVPLERLRRAMLSLADGNLEVSAAGADRRDEIGQMAKAVRVFKENAIINRHLQEEIRLQVATLEKRVAERTQDLVAANARLAEMATLDGLTGLFNRRHFFELAEREMARFRREKRPMGLAMVDIDHFKRINDRYGHPAGDKVIREVAARIQAGVRQNDIVARYGGEEIIVLMPDTTVEAAPVVAERIRRDVAAAQIRHQNVPIKVAISVGVAMAKPEQELLALIEEADAALYKAKQSGRNRTVVAGG
jgi:diguanylate cyclase (GGDEF)-like protein